MEFEYEYRREDENFRSVALWRRLGSPYAFLRSRYAVAAVLPVFLLAYLMLMGYVTVAAAVLGFITAFAWFWSRNLWAGMRIAADENSPVFGRKICKIDEKGISIESAAMKTWHSWTCIREIIDGPKYISIYYDLIRALVLPKKSFRSPEEMAQFLALMRKYASVSKIGEGPQQQSYESAAPRGRLAMPFLWIFILILTISVINLSSSFTSVSQIPDAVATVDKASVVDDSIVVLGHISNSGKSEWYINMLELKFFDGDGKFIDQCTAYTYGLDVKAGGTENFKASCSASPKAAVPGAGAPMLPGTLKHYARIEVKPKGAYKTGAWSLLQFY